jgi:low affinity Fe/Cu permease
MRQAFRHLAKWTAEVMGSPYAFYVALGVVAIWAACGPLFHFSNTWQLVINTGTTIITFLVVFLIQYVQNRDNRAIHLKLDELIKAIRGARDSIIDLDDLSDEQLSALETEYKRLCHHHPTQEKVG